MSLIHRSEKIVIIITGLLLALFIFATLYSRSKYNDLPVCVPYDKMYTIPKVIRLDEKTYQVYVVAQMWQFQPQDIYIPVGSEVDFFVTSKDVVHGFNIAQKNVNLTAIYGSINKATVKFDKPGVYKITCHEYCGVAHQNMQGKVIVNYPQSK